MSVALSVFDVFAYAVPGSLYLALGTFIASAMGWIDVGQVIRLPTLVLAGGIIVLSYLLGFVTYPLASGMDRVLPFRRHSSDARAEFLSRTPAALGRPYVDADMALLRAAVEVREKESGQEMTRLRAVAIMIRNCAVPLAMASVTAAVSAVAGGPVAMSVAGTVIFAAAAAAAIWQARRFRHWSNVKTLEICFWIPDIDDLVRPRRSPSRRGQARTLPPVPPASTGSPPPASP